MTQKEKQRVLDIVENEGLDYTFAHYTSFEDIKDKEFHKLRKEFIDARNKLAEFIGYES